MGHDRVVIVAAASALLLSACTSSTSAGNPTTKPSATTAVVVPEIATPSPTPSPTAPPFTPATPILYPRLPIPGGTARCHTAQIEIALVDEEAATGHLEYVFELRNSSGSACWVYGFPGFQPLDNVGRAMPLTITWSNETFFGVSDPPTRILLATGTAPLNSAQGTGHAFFFVWSGDVCVPLPPAASSFKIWPPDEYQALHVPGLVGNMRFVFCGGISVSPLQVQAHTHQPE